MAVCIECERCQSKFILFTDDDPELMQGICVNCQNESDTEKPLTFKAVEE